VPQLIRDVMTSPVVSVQPTTPLKTVARLLSTHSFRILPVVAANGTVLGVVSERDFLLKQRGPVATHRWSLATILGADRLGRHELAKIAATTAAEAMTSPAVTVDAGERIDRAAGAMLDQGVGSLPVVEAARLVGIVTRSDLVRVFTGSDEELAESIRQDVLRRTLLLPPAQFDVQVHNGVVHVRGHVEHKLLADLLADTIARHPGVIRVATEVTWERTEAGTERVPTLTRSRR
jgi:CBS-domain-containing membrane protein